MKSLLVVAAAALLVLLPACRSRACCRAPTRCATVPRATSPTILWLGEGGGRVPNAPDPVAGMSPPSMSPPSVPVWRAIQPEVESTPQPPSANPAALYLRLFDVQDLAASDEQLAALTLEVVGLLPAGRTVENKNRILIVRALGTELEQVSNHLQAKRRAAPAVLVR